MPHVEAASSEGLFEGAAGLARPLFGGGESPSGDDPFSLIHGLHSLTATLAEEHGLALIVDDVQWADEVSLQLLAYLAARSEGSATLIVSAAAQAPLDALHGAASLTPQERRITRLAVEGRSNREIAEALFLARRTVETHLSNAYVKLKIDGREQLAEALGS